MLVTMKCTRRGPAGVFPINQTLDVPEPLAVLFLKQKAAVQAGVTGKLIAGPDIESGTPKGRPSRRARKLGDPDYQLASEPVDELADVGLAGKVAETLRAAGVKTIADIKAHPDLTEIKGIGEVTAASILAAVETNRD